MFAEWLIWLAVGFVIMSCISGWGCVWTWRNHLTRRERHRKRLRRDHPLALRRDHWMSMSHVAPRVPARHRRRCVEPVPRPETPLEALQRRFVSDEITLEEYEQGVDRLNQLA